MANQTQHFETIAHACATLQKPYGVIRRALEAVGAQPEMVIDGRGHYSEEAIERAAEHIREARGKG